MEKQEPLKPSLFEAVVAMEKEDLKTFIIIGSNREGKVTFHTNSEDIVEILGLLEFAKVLEISYEEGED